ncbi:MAG: DUF975 family protein [Clostridia bacterium]|nr:DUF975 family protein [Clostridia bacterium]
MVAKDFRNKAWAALKGKWGTFALIAFIYSLIVSAVTATGIGSMLTVIVSGPLTLGVSIVSLKVIRGFDIDLKDMFEGFNNFLNSFLLGLVNAIFVFLWSLLFFVPGIIKQLSYSMSYYIMAENPEISQSDARKKSMEMMQGHKWRLFCLQFSFIGWILLSILTLGILLFWIMPYMQTAAAAFYEDLKTKQAQ